jgi:hypothetical protein
MLSFQVGLSSALDLFRAPGLLKVINKKVINASKLPTIKEMENF